MFTKRIILSVIISWIVGTALAIGISVGFNFPAWASFFIGVVFGGLSFNIGLFIGLSIEYK